MVLFGVQDNEIEYPEIASVASDNIDNEDDTEDEALRKTNLLSASKTHWGEDSKRKVYCLLLKE